MDTILEQEQQIEKLRQEIDTLRQENEQFKKILPQPQKTFYSKKSSTRRKPFWQWGRKTGHPGCPRPKPDHIDREVEQSLKSCPHCSHVFGEPVETVEHLQEEIVPARVEVTRFKRHRYWCGSCRKVITAALCAR